MLSIIIAAHNEEPVIGSCLDAIRNGLRTDAEIIVSANGCTDRTVEVAREHRAAVIDRPEPGKPGALNAADELATGYPRVYLDADIRVPEGGVAALERLLDQGALAAVPRRRVDTSGRPLAVRAYFAINERLPVFRDGLFGRGMIAVSESGRRRFDRFPAMIADDLFLDSQFSAAEKAEATSVEVVVEAPRTTKALVNRLVRVRRGNAEMRSASASGEVAVAIRPSDKWAWLRDVILPNPHLVFAAVPYLVITVTAALRARRAPDTADAWGRDESTRQMTPDLIGSTG
ncbi:glycosyltransferase family 2 protein [Microbacterium trichothecenolyticum]|uniref:4,4'-diaponeurosporenoate glycosyltransferase n=1 Tax=Microbacterium trichothecenolyticum TaxID=69370 RepID=A0A0M2HHL7_MICTR|nr:glycosyltransferase [Microbacterium trichothecenolyticum]KJL43796.1 Hyaluronan synthase [Microbacterium trichothecenolyticum]